MGAAAAGIAIGGQLIGNYMQGRQGVKSTHEASDLSQFYAQKAREDIAPGYAKAREEYMPWLTTGKAAQNIIADLSGANGPEAQARAYENFKTDPSYKFRVEQANKALGRSALAKGNIFSGNFAAASDELNQGLAFQGYSDYYNRLLGLSGTGYNAAASRSNLFANEGVNLGNIDIGVGTTLGNAAVSAGQSKSDMYGNLFNTIGQGAGLAYGMGMFGGGATPGTGSVTATTPTVNASMYNPRQNYFSGIQ